MKRRRIRGTRRSSEVSIAVRRLDGSTNRLRRILQASEITLFITYANPEISSKGLHLAHVESMVRNVNEAAMEILREGSTNDH